MSTAEANRLMADLRSKGKQELQALREEYAPLIDKNKDLEAKLTEFQKVLDERLPPVQSDEGEKSFIDEFEKRLEIPSNIKDPQVRATYKRLLRKEMMDGEALTVMRAELNEVRELNKRLAEQDAARQKREEEARRDAAIATRRSRIDTMIAQFSAVLPDRGDEAMRPWLQERTVEKGTGFFFKADPSDPTDDNLLPFTKETVDKYVPGYLRKAATGGREGGGSGGTRTAPTAGQVEALEQELSVAIEQGTKATAGDKNRWMQVVQKLKRQIAEAKRQSAMAA